MGLKVKAFYTVAEIAKAAHQQPRQVARVLQANQVKLYEGGSGGDRSQLVVMLVDLRDGFPAFYESLLEVLRVEADARHVAGEHLAFEEDDAAA